MGISVNGIKNINLKNSTTQIKNNSNNKVVESNVKDINQEKEVQKIAFELMFQQMMKTTGNSMMKEVLSSALSQENSFSPNNSLSALNALSNFNSVTRNASYSQQSLKAYSKGTNNGIAKLGLKASKYESNLNPGAISNTPGDFGGKSYGAWQFSSKTGSLDGFINSLKEKHSNLYSILSQAKIKDGNKFGQNFDAAWTNIASSSKEEFLKVQQDCVKQNYYDKISQDLNSKFGFDINKKSDALKESLWSTVVQHGVGGTLSVFSNLNLNKDDSAIINDLYNERQKVDIYFRSSSEEVKQSVYNRFTREKQDMLAMLEGDFA